MNALNESFLEAYTKLDKLCCELYNSEKGVTSYIDDMKDIPASRCGEIPEWNTDLKRLVELRHLRNRLCNGDEALCTQEDAAWLDAFYSRILEGSDPMTLLNKQSMEPKKAKKKKEKKQAAAEKTQKKGKKGDKAGAAGLFAIFLGIFLILLALGVIAILALSFIF